MARRRRRSRGNAGDAWKLVGGIALVLVTFAVVAGWIVMRLDVADRPVLSEETLCPTDGPRGITVVLLDASDGLPEIAQQEVRGYLVGLSEELEPYSLLELRLLDPSVRGGRVVFSRCNPGDGSNLNELIGNPQLARRQWLEGFRQPLEDALNGFLGPA